MRTGWAVPTQVVDRPALREELDRSLTQPLSLLVAQAGAGKTVLLAQWAEQHPELVFLWLDIVAEDNDPARLAARLSAELATLEPRFSDLTGLVTSDSDSFGEPFLTAFSQLLGDLPPLVIVLDDLHHLSNRAAIDDIVWLVDRLPRQVHLVISTRVDLPLSWVRHRLHDDVTEIRSADLAFDNVDSAKLLEHISGRTLTPAAVALLVKRTEGWAAGLQLAGLTLKGRDDSDAFIAQFGGTDRLIADYLGEEVLRAQPDSLRRRMLLASSLDEMCGDLMTAVTGENDTHQFFETLERESLFLVPLDSHREWFRFHPLFRDLLRYYLRAEAPEAEQMILTRAAAWHVERGEVNRAVEYLLRAKDWDSALALIGARGSEVYERSEMRTVIRWITELAPALPPDRVDVSLLIGVLRALEGQMVVAEEVLRRVISDAHASDGQRMVARAILAARAQWSPHPETSIDVAVRAINFLEEHPDTHTPDVLGITDRSSLRTLTLLSGGRSHFLNGDLAESQRWLRRALASEGASYPPWRVGILGSLALVEAWHGRTSLAAELVTEACEIAHDAKLSDHPATADAHLASALIAQERAQTARASSSLREGITRAAANGRTQLMWVGYLLQARMLETQSEHEHLPPSGGPPPPVVRDRLSALYHRTRRLNGNSARALVAETDGRNDSSSVPFERVAMALTQLRPDTAREILRTAPKLPAVGQPLVEVQHLILLAWLADVENRTAVGQRYLTDALGRAHADDLVDVFLRAGPPVIDQLHRLPGPKTEFHQRILEGASELLGSRPVAGLPTPLTSRELEILLCLPSRSSNTELAERFFVSVNTIKTHTVHIYRKLDVPNRNAAISRARELGLLQ